MRPCEASVRALQGEMTYELASKTKAWTTLRGRKTLITMVATHQYVKQTCAAQ